MEVLTSPVSSLLHPSNHHQSLHLLKSPLPYSYSNPPSFKPNPPFSLSSLSSSKPLSPLSLSPPPPPPPPTTLTPPTHHRASTGYAAALIDFSNRCETLTLASIARDVNRLASSIASIIADSSMIDEERAKAVRATVETGGFDRRLVAVVRIVVSRGAEEVANVLEEFMRIWREMNLGTAKEADVVVVSEKKMGIEQLAMVAREVRRTSGADQVKVKHLFRRRSLRFAI